MRAVWAQRHAELFTHPARLLTETEIRQVNASSRRHHHYSHRENCFAA
jgi:hypothetical protein